jgi:hypothetical protein
VEIGLWRVKSGRWIGKWKVLSGECICFTGFGSTGPSWIAMDAKRHGEGPSRMNNEELNPHDEALNELYGESQEDEEIDPIDFNLPFEGDVTMEDIHSIHSKSGQDDWMKTIIIAAKGSEYSGEDTEYFAERSQLVDIFKYFVNEAIRMSHVPAEQHGYVARNILTGKIANHVLLIAAKSPDKVLSKEQIFEIVDAGIQGTTPGLITRREKFLNTSALLIGLDIKRKTGKVPELSLVL